MDESTLMRIQYEILNATPKELSVEYSVPLSVIMSEIANGGWVQKWPDLPSIMAEAVNANNDDTDESSMLMSADEAVSADMQQYIDMTRKRLQVFSLVKAKCLATHYMKLEMSLINTAQQMIDTLSYQMGPQAIKQLSALYKDMTSGASLANMLTSSSADDDTGLPLMLVKDLSGNR